MADRKGLNTVKSGAASEADVRSPLAPRIASQAGVPKKHAHPRAASFVHHAVLAHGAQLVCQGDLLRFCELASAVEVVFHPILGVQQELILYGHGAVIAVR